MPKRILLVDYPDGEARAAALRAMGHEVRMFNLLDNRIWPGSNPVRSAAAKFLRVLRPLYSLAGALDRHKLNAELAAAAREFRPELVLVVKGNRFSAATYAELKKTGNPLMINWYPDSVLAPEACAFVAEHRKYFDHFFLIDELDALPPPVRASVSADAPGIHTLPLAANTEYFHPLSLPEDRRRSFESSVAFVGAVNAERKKILSSLAGLNLKIWAPLVSPWGPWLEEGSPLKERYQGGCVFGEEVVRIYGNASILLDIHFLFPTSPRIANVTTRVYEVPAAGGFILTNASAQLSKLFTVGEEIVCYDSAADLKDKVNYYLAHPAERARIAEAGRRRVLRDHTYTNRLRAMFGILGLS